MDSTSTAPRRSALVTSGQRIAMTVIFLLGALTALRFGITQYEDWQVRSRTEFQHLALGLIEGLLLVVLAGFLFALAARLPPSLRYRIWPPLLLGIVPFLMLAQFVAVFGSQWSAPKILLDQRFYLSPQAQFALVVMVGVALASGFGSEERSPEEHS